MSHVPRVCCIAAHVPHGMRRRCIALRERSVHILHQAAAALSRTNINSPLAATASGIPAPTHPIRTPPGRICALCDAHAGGDVHPTACGGAERAAVESAARVPGPFPCSAAAAAAAPRGVQAQRIRDGGVSCARTRGPPRAPLGGFQAQCVCDRDARERKHDGVGKRGREQPDCAGGGQRHRAQRASVGFGLAPLSRGPTPGPRSGTPQPQPTGFLAVPGAANSIGAGVGRDKEKDQASIALRAMRIVQSMARLWDGPGAGQRSVGGAGAREGEQEGGAGEPAHVGGEEADAAE
ncbi:hypothetical protein B0H14DRAFT_3667871 [Mycena olivaceomarginata]|nr:hypothetical protein B0H14DRAFT_3667871 [Mycena olivaceomarginata]